MDNTVIWFYYKITRSSAFRNSAKPWFMKCATIFISLAEPSENQVLLKPITNNSNYFQQDKFDYLMSIFVRIVAIFVKAYFQFQ